MPFREGEAFHKGDLLVRFDCSAYQAQLAASQAAARAAQQELAQNRQLAEMNSNGMPLPYLRHIWHRHWRKVRSIKYKPTVAARPPRLMAASCRVRSRLRNMSVREHRCSTSWITAIWRSTRWCPRWLSALKPKQTFVFTRDETGIPLQAEILRLGARIDEGSQTLTLIGR